MPNISEIWVSLGVDNSEFKRGTREANAIAGATVAQITDEFSKVKINVKSFSAVASELKALKDRAAELKSALVNAEPRSTAWGKLSGELKATQDRMKALGPVADALKEKMEKVASGFGKIGDAALKVGAVVGAAYLGAAVLAGKSFEDVEGGWHRIITLTGAEGQELESLKASYAAVGSKSSASFEEIGNAIGGIHTRLGLTGKPLEDFATSVLEVARMTKGSVEGLVTDTTRAMNSWGVANDQAAGSLDRLFAVSQHTGIPIAALSEDMVKFGPIMRAMGFGFDQSAAMIGNFEKAGVPVDRMVRGLSASITKLAKDGQAPATAIADLMQRMKDAKSDTEALQIASSVLSGSVAVTLTDAIRRGTLSVDDLVASLAEAPGAVQRASDATADFSTKWKRMKNDLALKFAPVGIGGLDAIGKVLDHIRERFDALQAAGKLQPMLDALAGAMKTVADVAMKIADGVANLVEKFANLPKPVQDAITKAVLLAPVFLLAGGAILKLISGIITLGGSIAMMGGWTAILAKIATAFKVVWAAITGPIGIVVAALIVVGVALYELYQKNEKFRALVQTVWGQITSLISNSLAKIKDWWDQHGTEMLAKATTVWNSIVTVVGAATTLILQVVSVALTILSGIWDKFGTWIMDTTGRAFGYIADVIGGAMSAVGNLITAALSILSGNWNDAWQAMADASLDILYGVLSPLKTIVGGIAGTVLLGVSAAVDGIANLADKLKALPGMAAVANALHNAAGAVAGASNTVFDFALAPRPASAQKPTPFKVSGNPFSDIMSQIQAFIDGLMKGDKLPGPLDLSPGTGGGGGGAGGGGGKAANAPTAQPEKPPSYAQLSQDLLLAQDAATRLNAQLSGDIDQETRLRLQGELAVNAQQQSDALALYNLKGDQAKALSATMTNTERDVLKQQQADELIELQTIQTRRLDDIKADTDAQIAALKKVQQAQDDALAYRASVQDLLLQRQTAGTDALVTAQTKVGDALAESVGGGLGDLIKANVALATLAETTASKMAGVEEAGEKTIEAAVLAKARELGKTNPQQYLIELNTEYQNGTAPDWFAKLMTDLQKAREQVTGEVWKQKIELDTDKMKAQLLTAKDALISGVQGLEGNNDQWRAGFKAGVEQGYQTALKGLDKGIPGVIATLNTPPPTLTGPSAASLAGFTTGAQTFTAAAGATIPPAPPLPAAPVAAPVAAPAPLAPPVAQSLPPNALTLAQAALPQQITNNQTVIMPAAPATADLAGLVNFSNALSTGLNLINGTAQQILAAVTNLSRVVAIAIGIPPPTGAGDVLNIAAPVTNIQAGPQLPPTIIQAGATPVPAAPVNIGQVISVMVTNLATLTNAITTGMNALLAAANKILVALTGAAPTTPLPGPVPEGATGMAQTGALPIIHEGVAVPVQKNQEIFGPPRPVGLPPEPVTAHGVAGPQVQVGAIAPEPVPIPTMPIGATGMAETGAAPIIHTISPEVSDENAKKQAAMPKAISPEVIRGAVTTIGGALGGALAQISQQIQQFSATAGGLVSPLVTATAGVGAGMMAAAPMLQSPDFTARLQSPQIANEMAKPQVFGPANLAAQRAEQRVIITVEPSPLFEVKTRETVIKINEQNDLRNAMGASKVKK